MRSANLKFLAVLAGVLLTLAACADRPVTQSRGGQSSPPPAASSDTQPTATGAASASSIPDDELQTLKSAFVDVANADVVGDKAVDPDSIKYFVTDLSTAGRVLSGSSDPTGANAGSISVTVICATGSFQANNGKIPPGSPVPIGTFLYEVFNNQTQNRVGFGLLVKEPDLSNVNLAS